MSYKPLCIELFAGMFGWGAGFIAEGFDVIGFDIIDVTRELGLPRTPGCQLVLQDVQTLHGSQFKDAAVIVASPPCQAYSYRAMPWKRAKAWPPPDNSLFEVCFRIAREAGVPIVVENVCGAQKWIGRAKWHYGSFYLWGDVPALMPIGRAIKNSRNWWSDGAGTLSATTGSHSKARKAASAQIAKIPFPLARWIAMCYYPSHESNKDQSRSNLPSVDSYSRNAAAQCS